MSVVLQIFSAAEMNRSVSLTMDGASQRQLWRNLTMSVSYSRVPFNLLEGGGKDISVFAGSLNPNGVNSVFSSRVMRLARIGEAVSCGALSVFIWETCLAI